MNILENKDGCYYTQAKESGIRNQIVSDKVYLAVNDSPDNWKQIPKEEGDRIKKGQEVLQDINSVGDLDNVIKGAGVVPLIINEVPMTDNEALERKAYYPKWNEFIGRNLNVGFKVVYEDKLYKVRQQHTVQEHFFPGSDTASLYEEICEKHAGTIEDPIPYNNNMELFNGKYYTQYGEIYKCTRDTQVPIYQDLSELVGIYVELVSM